MPNVCTILLVNLQRRHGAFPMFVAKIAQYAHICGANVAALVSLPDAHALANVCRRDMDGRLYLLPVVTSPEAFLASRARRAVS